MFWCPWCNLNSLPGVKPVKVLLQDRGKEYPVREGANKRYGVVADDPGGYGWEIVKETFYCPSCADKK